VALLTNQRPHDPDQPVVCLDETRKQLIKETRVPVPAKPGKPALHDYEYERNGTASLFMLLPPGTRHSFRVAVAAIVVPTRMSGVHCVAYIPD
jgi:hypothetical protein